MEYLQNATLCLDSGKPRYGDIPPNGHYESDSTMLERKQRLSRSSRQSIISPVTRAFKTSAALVNSTVLSMRDGLTEEQRTSKIRLEEKRQILQLRLKNASTIHEWRTAAHDLDVITGNESWKADPESADFDKPLIEKRLQELDEARINCDVTRMMYLVRTALSRDLGGMGNISLYKNSYIGTKNLIERYIDSALDTIRSLVKIASSNMTLPDGLETKDILEQVVYARQAFGRSALLLSGGATFGMNHVGVLKALFEARLLPRIISGASAGSIVAAVLCTRTDEELPDVLRQFPYGNLAVFEDKDRPDGILERVRRFLTQGAWIDIKYLTGVMRELLGDMTFQEAYNRSRRILNICVSSASVYELPRLLNYITSPNIMIWSAVAASCSVPLIFSAAQLLVKNPITGEHCPWDPTPQKWIDGSVDNDLPMTRLAEMFNVNHFIVSQVNPHVIPFLVRDEEAISHAANQSSSSSWNTTSLIYTITDLAKGEALHRLHVLAEMGIFPNLATKARSILSQKYSGDITILPEIDLGDMPRMLKNPTTEFMCRTCLAGERATWPKLSRIRNHCAVELELDLAVQQLRARVVFSPSQVDLRRMNSSERGRGMSRNVPTKSHSRRESLEYGSPEPKRRPPIWRAASHHVSHRKQNSMSQAFELSTPDLEFSSPPQDINSSFFHDNQSQPNSISQEDGSQEQRTSRHRLVPDPNHSSKFKLPNIDLAASYFSGLESEATQEYDSISPVSRLLLGGDEDNESTTDADNADVESTTDDSSSDTASGVGNNEIIPSTVRDREPVFLFPSQPNTPGGAGSGGGGSTTPWLSSLLSREQLRLPDDRTRGLDREETR